MRNYELAYIADPELDEEALQALEERVKSWVEAAQGTIVDVERWGKRKLAYPIQRRIEGYYYILKTDMPASAGREIERDLGIDQNILRYLITLRGPES